VDETGQPRDREQASGGSGMGTPPDPGRFSNDAWASTTGDDAFESLVASWDSGQQHRSSGNTGQNPGYPSSVSPAQDAPVAPVPQPRPPTAYQQMMPPPPDLSQMDPVPLPPAVGVPPQSNTPYPNTPYPATPYSATSYPMPSYPAQPSAQPSYPAPSYPASSHAQSPYQMPSYPAAPSAAGPLSMPAQHMPVVPAPATVPIPPEALLLPEELPRRGTPPSSGAPAGAVPTSGVPSSGFPSSGVPFTGAPVSSAPTSAIPAGNAPTSSVPASSVPISSVPTSSVPISSVPTSSLPTSSVPSSFVSASGVPTSSVPTSSVPTSSAASGDPNSDLYPTRQWPSLSRDWRATPSSAPPVSGSSSSASSFPTSGSGVGGYATGGRQHAPSSLRQASPGYAPPSGPPASSTSGLSGFPSGPSYGSPSAALTAPSGLPLRVPARPDVPDVPGGLSEFDDLADTPDLDKIADYLSRPHTAEPSEDFRPEGFDIPAVIDAVRDVPGVRQAQMRPNPNGVHTLRLDLSDNADPAEVSRAVARLLKEKMGLAAEPNEAPQTRGTTSSRSGFQSAPPSWNPRSDTQSTSGGTGTSYSNRPAVAPRGETQTGSSRPSTGSSNEGRRRRPASGITAPAGSPAQARGGAEPGGSAAGSGSGSASGTAVGSAFSGGQQKAATAGAFRLGPGIVPAPRAVLDQVKVTDEGFDAVVEVRLTVRDRPALGVANGPAYEGYVLRLAAVATASAVDQLIAEDSGRRVRCFVEHVTVASMGGGCEVALVVLLLAGDGWVDHLTGSALVTGDPRYAVVRATLAAVNRRLEALLTR
jgi:hypothetical protein